MMKIDHEEIDRLQKYVDGAMTEKILDWINEIKDHRPFNRKDIIHDLSLYYRNDLHFQSLTYIQLNRALQTLCAGGYIEAVPNMTFGWYRPIIKDACEINPWDFQGEDADIWLPLGLADKVKIFQGDIILFAGSPNVGKTALTMNVAKENALKGWEVKYFNSEMSAPELSERLNMFSAPRSSWDNVKFYRRSDNFQDVVVPGKNVLNIIDFLQIHKDFYSIGATLFEIHKRLGDSLCIINMQKNPGNETALGGFRTLELPRLAVAVDFQKALIVKAKAWRDKDRNPNGAECAFKLIHGHNFVPMGGVDFKWYTAAEPKGADKNE